MLHLIQLRSVDDPYFKTGIVFGETPDQEAKRREDSRVDYKTLLLTIIQRGNGTGFTLDDVEKGTNVLRAIRKVETGDTLKLEDADYNYLMDQVRGFRYGVIDERIADFKHDLENAATEDPNAPPPVQEPEAEPEPAPPEPPVAVE